MSAAVRLRPPPTREAPYGEAAADAADAVEMAGSLSVCPFGADCPNAMACREAQTKYQLAVDACDVLRRTHDEAIERYATLTTRLSTEAQSLAESHESNEHIAENAMKRLRLMTAERAELKHRLAVSDSKCAALAEENAKAGTTIAELLERLQQVSETTDTLTSKYEAALMKIRVQEERWERHFRESVTDPRAAGSTLPATVRPMVDAVGHLSSLRAVVHPLQYHDDETQGDHFRSPSLGKVLDRKSDDDATPPSRELAEKSRQLAEMCVERPELKGLLRRLRTVQDKNLELRSTLHAAEHQLQTESDIARAQARAEEVYWAKKAAEAATHASQWRERAEACRVEDS